MTTNGRPLYTFAEDSPGKSTGDGFTDDFDGVHFEWHVVLAGGKPNGEQRQRQRRRLGPGPSERQLRLGRILT